MVPRSGAGALTFYQGFSEPRSAELICRFLQPGMVFWDVGAHVGEYTLLAAARVGQLGEVHAFEPNLESIRLLQRNVILNGLPQVVLNRVAAADVTEERVFRTDVEPSLSRLVCGTTGDISERLMRLDAVCLDDYAGGQRRPHPIKIDTEGAEGLVLRGMRKLLAQPADRASVLVFEYSPANYRAFGYDAREVLALLEAVRYQVYLPAKARLVSSGQLTGLLGRWKIISGQLKIMHA